MANTFSLILVVITLVTGVVWLLEKLVWGKERQQKLTDVESKTNGLDSAAAAKVTEQPWWVENSVSIFPVISLVLILRSFVYEPFQIPSGSMMPTLLVGDFILVEKYAYGLKDPVWRSQLLETGDPERGDIVVFKVPVDNKTDYIKRVIGVPGDKVLYNRLDKHLCVQRATETQCQPMEYSDIVETDFIQHGYGVAQATESYDDISYQILATNNVADMTTRYYKNRKAGREVYQWTVPADHYFVMGDNRDNSTDSRVWGFVPKENLVGKAVAIWISFEFERGADSVLPKWVPTGVRFNRIGGIS